MMTVMTGTPQAPPAARSAPAPASDPRAAGARRCGRGSKAGMSRVAPPPAPPPPPWHAWQQLLRPWPAALRTLTSIAAGQRLRCQLSVPGWRCSRHQLEAAGGARSLAPPSPLPPDQPCLPPRGAPHASAPALHANHVKLLLCGGCRNTASWPTWWQSMARIGAGAPSPRACPAARASSVASAGSTTWCPTSRRWGEAAAAVPAGPPGPRVGRGCGGKRPSVRVQPPPPPCQTDSSWHAATRRRFASSRLQACTWC